MRFFPLLLLPPLVLAGCTAVPTARPVVAPTRSAPMRATGLERVLGANARGLVALFGPADQDVHEEGAQRLQFRGPICVLDAYLYASGSSRDPVVTYIDARQPDGRDIDRASCVAAMIRRKEAR
jgi:hypothetical protein